MRKGYRQLIAFANIMVLSGPVLAADICPQLRAIAQGALSNYASIKGRKKDGASSSPKQTAYEGGVIVPGASWCEIMEEPNVRPNYRCSWYPGDPQLAESLAKQVAACFPGDTVVTETSDTGFISHVYRGGGVKSTVRTNADTRDKHAVYLWMELMLTTDKRS